MWYKHYKFICIKSGLISTFPWLFRYAQHHLRLILLLIIYIFVSPVSHSTCLHHKIEYWVSSFFYKSLHDDTRRCTFASRGKWPECYGTEPLFFYHWFLYLGIFFVNFTLANWATKYKKLRLNRTIGCRQVIHIRGWMSWVASFAFRSLR